MADPFEPLELQGPRIVFVDPVPWEFLERSSWLLRHVAMTSPPLVDDVLVVTSTVRPLGDKPSYHPGGWAFDVRTGINPEKQVVDLARPGAIVGKNPMDIALAWRSLIITRAGVDVDVQFGDADHINHIHVEWDQRKRATPAHWG